MTAVLAGDLGGSSLRLALVAGDGTVLVAASRTMEMAAPAGGRAEQDPDVWWLAFRRLAAQLLDHPKARAIAVGAICMAGVTRTQVFVDADGRVLRPAITWRDSRAVAEAAMVAEALRAAEPDAAAGYGPVNAYHPLARLAWVAGHEPDVAVATRWVMQPKDFLNFRLTGSAAGDLYSSHHFLRPGSGEVAATVFQRLGLDAGVVPPLGPPEARIGCVSPGLPPPFDRLEGVPVFAGSMDSWCCALGIGANRDGAAYVVSGTSEVLGLITREPARAPGLVTLAWGDGLTHIGGPSQAGGDCLAWFADAFGAGGEIPSLVRRLAGEPRDPEPVIFVPFLTGERTPLWNPDARGVFFGLGRRHRAVDMMWSVIEGVAFANRHVLDLAEEAAGARAEEIRITGGAARLDVWCQVKADVTGRPVLSTVEKEAGVFGAALVALQGLGLHPDREALQEELVRDERRFTPDPDRAAFYDRLYPVYRRLVDDAGPAFAALADVRAGQGRDERPTPHRGGQA